MSRKVVVEVKVKLVLDMDEGVEVGEVIQEMDYSFTPTSTLGPSADVVETEILDYEVKDSR